MTRAAAPGKPFVPWLTDAMATIRRQSRALWLRYEIDETERYLADCAKDGLIRSLHLDEWRTRLAEMRVELATLAPPLKQTTPVTTTAANRSRT